MKFLIWAWDYLTRAEVAEQTALSLVQTREFVEACERPWPQ